MSCLLKFYKYLNAQGQHWVPVGIAAKRVLLSVPPAGFMLLLFPFTTLFSILTSSLSCLSLVFCRRVRCTRHISGWGNIMPGRSSRLCPPSNPILPILHSTLKVFKVFVGWNKYVLKKVQHLGNVLCSHNCSSKIRRKFVNAPEPASKFFFILFLWLAKLDKVSLCVIANCILFTEQQTDTRDGMKVIQ